MQTKASMHAHGLNQDVRHLPRNSGDLMLQTLRLKTSQYACSRLGETVVVDTFAAYYTDSLDEYPPNAQIPFAHTSRNMFCCGSKRCGITTTKDDGSTEYLWHLCPALETLKQRYSLPKVTSELAAS